MYLSKFQIILQHKEGINQRPFFSLLFSPALCIGLCFFARSIIYLRFLSQLPCLSLPPSQAALFVFASKRSSIICNCFLVQLPYPLLGLINLKFNAVKHYVQRFRF